MLHVVTLDMDVKVIYIFIHLDRYHFLS